MSCRLSLITTIQQKYLWLYSTSNLIRILLHDLLKLLFIYSWKNSHAVWLEGYSKWKKMLNIFKRNRSLPSSASIPLYKYGIRKMINIDWTQTYTLLWQWICLKIRIANFININIQINFQCSEKLVKNLIYYIKILHGLDRPLLIGTINKISLRKKTVFLPNSYTCVKTVIWTPQTLVWLTNNPIMSRRWM